MLESGEAKLEVDLDHVGVRRRVLVQKWIVVGFVVAVVAWVAVVPHFYVSTFAGPVSYGKGVEAEWRYSPLTGFADFYHAWGCVNAGHAEVRIAWHIATENLWGSSRYVREVFCTADSNGFFDSWTWGYDYWLTEVTVEVYVDGRLIHSEKVK